MQPFPTRTLLLASPSVGDRECVFRKRVFVNHRELFYFRQGFACVFFVIFLLLIVSRHGPFVVVEQFCSANMSRAWYSVVVDSTLKKLNTDICSCIVSALHRRGIWWVPSLHMANSHVHRVEAVLQLFLVLFFLGGGYREPWLFWVRKVRAGVVRLLVEVQTLVISRCSAT